MPRSARALASARSWTTIPCPCWSSTDVHVTTTHAGRDRRGVYRGVEPSQRPRRDRSICHRRRIGQSQYRHSVHQRYLCDHQRHARFSGGSHQATGDRARAGQRQSFAQRNLLVESIQRESRPHSRRPGGGHDHFRKPARRAISSSTMARPATARPLAGRTSAIRWPTISTTTTTPRATAATRRLGHSPIWFPEKYQVFVRWSQFTNRATNAPTRSTTNRPPWARWLVNQQLRPRAISPTESPGIVSAHSAISSSILAVKLSDNANGYVTADAVRIVPLAPPSPQVPEIDVAGFRQSIADGAMAPGVDDGTDFGNVVAVTNSSTRTFTISNTGNADLHLTGSPPVKIRRHSRSQFPGFHRHHAAERDGGRRRQHHVSGAVPSLGDRPVAGDHLDRQR